MTEVSTRFRSWLALKKLSATERMVAEYVRLDRKLQRRLDGRLKKLVAVRRRFQAEADAAVEDMEAAAETARSQRDAVEALRSELKIVEETTVPTLTAEHERVLACVKAGIAEAVRREVGALPGGRME